MKSLISFAVLAFFLLTANNAFAGGKLEKKLMKDGWVKVTAMELRALKDFTASDGFGWAEYVDSSGKQFVTQEMSGILSKGTREITADGQYCHHHEGAPAICRSLWRRGKDYLSVKYNVMVGGSKSEVSLNIDGQFTIKPGNTENL